MLFHNPVILARRFATLDILSHGRVIAGLGIGWSKDEYEASGALRANEFLQLLKQIWMDEIYSISASKIGPKPVQKPHPPISPNTFLRIVNYADGWIPVAGFGPTTDKRWSKKKRSEALSSIAQSLAQSNKPDDTIQITNQINGARYRSEALSSIAQSLAQSNRLDEAQRMFDEAIKAASAIEDNNRRSALSRIIVEKLEVKDRVSKIMLQEVLINIIRDLYEVASSSLKRKNYGIT
jgi:alkanesulfonate monooxygenase SsuD/methylene tetrahydromethanopterin reductase-like flavin-dependent oxidoreductase (luciferase family)